MKFKNVENTTDPLGDKSFNFALKMIRLFKFLQYEKKEFIMSKQVFRSGTNPGAMVREARNGQSGKDFIHKLSIGQKEISETQYWLELLNAANYIDDSKFKILYHDADEIKKMLRSSIITKKRRLGIKLGAIIFLIISVISIFLY